VHPSAHAHSHLHSHFVVGFLPSRPRGGEKADGEEEEAAGAFYPDEDETSPNLA